MSANVDPHAIAVELCESEGVTVAVVPTPIGSPAPLWVCLLHDVGGIPVTRARALASLERYGDELNLPELLEHLAIRAAVAGHRDARRGHGNR